MTGEAKGDQIDETRGMGIQKGKTQEGGKHQMGRGSELVQASCLESQQKGRRRGRFWTAAAREYLMFKEDLQGFMNLVTPSLLSLINQ